MTSVRFKKIIKSSKMDELGELRKSPLPVKEAERYFVGAVAAPHLKSAILETLLRGGKIRISISKEDIKEGYYRDQERRNDCFRAYLVALGPSRRSFLGRRKTEEQLEKENQKKRDRLEEESRKKIGPEIIEPLHELATLRNQNLGSLLLEAGEGEDEKLTEIVRKKLSDFGLEVNKLINEVRLSTKR